MALPHVLMLCKACVKWKFDERMNCDVHYLKVDSAMNGAIQTMYFGSAALYRVVGDMRKSEVGERKVGVVGYKCEIAGDDGNSVVVN
jgi:hypothetical protein